MPGQPAHFEGAVGGGLGGVAGVFEAEGTTDLRGDTEASERLSVDPARGR